MILSSLSNIEKKKRGVGQKIFKMEAVMTPRNGKNFLFPSYKCSFQSVFCSLSKDYVLFSFSSQDDFLKTAHVVLGPRQYLVTCELSSDFHILFFIMRIICVSGIY